MEKTPDEAFIDQLGLHFETAGMPLMMGRMLAWLLICEPRHQSSQQLMKKLGTSSGTVSTNTRLLMLGGMIEKVNVPGERATFFRIPSDGWHRMLEQHMKHTVEVKRLVDAGIQRLEGQHDTSRLRDLSELYEGFERHFEELLAEWDSQHSH